MQLKLPAPTSLALALKLSSSNSGGGLARGTLWPACPKQALPPAALPEQHVSRRPRAVCVDKWQVRRVLVRRRSCQPGAVPACATRTLHGPHVRTAACACGAAAAAMPFLPHTRRTSRTCRSDGAGRMTPVSAVPPPGSSRQWRCLSAEAGMLTAEVPCDALSQGWTSVWHLPPWHLSPRAHR